MFKFVKEKKHQKSNNLRRYITCILMLIALCRFPATLRSIEPAFTSVTDESGVPMFGITSLAQDSDGFVWAASRMGVLRATVADCKLYELPYAHANVMQVRLAYTGGTLVAATQNGQLFRYDRIHDRFDRLCDMSRQLGMKEWITSVAVDPAGKVWLGTSVGIYVYDQGKLKKLNTTSSGYSYVTPGKEGEIMGISGCIFYCFDTKDYKANRLPGRLGGLFSSMKYNPNDGRLWLGRYSGKVHTYNPRTGVVNRNIIEDFPRLIVRDIQFCGKDKVYVAVEGGGILKVDANAKKIVGRLADNPDNPSSIKGNSIYSVLIDSQKRLWTASTSGGLQYSSRRSPGIEHVVHAIDNPQSLGNDDVNGMISDRNGNLWVATNDGISRRNALSGEWSHFLKGHGLAVLSLSEDSEGRIYASTYGNGVYVLDGATGMELQHLTKENAELFGEGGFVFASLTDSDGEIWLGGVKGRVVRLNPLEGKVREYASLPVFCLAEQSPGVILAGGGEGIWRIDKRNCGLKNILSDEVVTSMALTGDMIWACTSGNGVIGINSATGEKIQLSVKDGLQSNHIRGVVASGNDLWISTARGICCYDAASRSMRTLPGKDLLTRGIFSGNAAGKMPGGKLAFGSSNGVIIFHPDSLLSNHPHGHLYFSDVRVDGKSVKEMDDFELKAPVDDLTELELSYPYNSFTLHAIPMGDVSQSMGYSWKLEGVDKEWSEISPQSYINYVNLQGGSYTLRVRLYDGCMLDERVLKVEVTPALWQRGWFQILMLLILIVVIDFVVQQYLQRVRLVTRVKSILRQRRPANAPRILRFRLEGKEISGETEEDGAHFLKRAAECVRENIGDEQFGKAEFSAAMAMSQSLLYKRIKALTGMSVIEFIRSLRLEYSMELLRTGNYTATEVSEMSGFTTLAYFSRLFKDRFGRLPSEILEEELGVALNP